MRIAKTLGTVTLSRCLPSFEQAALKIAAPLTLEELATGAEPQAESLVVYDQLGAGEGSTIALSEGGEAAQPFRPDLKPVDAYCAAILDHVHLPGKDLPESESS